MSRGDGELVRCDDTAPHYEHEYASVDGAGVECPGVPSAEMKVLRDLWLAYYNHGGDSLAPPEELDSAAADAEEFYELSWPGTWYQRITMDLPPVRAQVGAVAWGRGEREPCEKGTIGCCVNHDRAPGDWSCATW